MGTTWWLLLAGLLLMPPVIAHSQGEIPDEAEEIEAAPDLMDTVEPMDSSESDEWSSPADADAESESAPDPDEEITNAEKAENIEAQKDAEEISETAESISPMNEEAPITEENYTPGVKKIPHPMAKKGLIRITKDQIYRYRVPTSAQDRAASVRFGLFDPSNLENSDAGIPFSEIYTNSEAPLLLVDYEWQLWRGSLGKIGLKVGTGIFVATGNGRFAENSVNAGLPAREGFTFVVFPNNAGAIYRFQFWDRQPLVPYVEGGLDAFTFTEFRDDDKGPKFGGALAGHGSVGASLNLNYFDLDSMLELDRDYGINTVWLTVEGRIYQAITNKFDFSGEVINAGVTVEF